jgi:hypothetical protein
MFFTFQGNFNAQTLNGLGVREFLLSTTNAASFLALGSVVFMCACVKPKLQELRESFSRCFQRKIEDERGDHASSNG